MFDRFVRVSLRPATLFLKKHLAQVFYCEFCEIFKNTFFTEHLANVLLKYRLQISPLILSEFVLVISCLGRRFEINFPSAFLKILNCPPKTRAISKFSKITRVIYPQNCQNQTCGYWLITPNQQTLCMETNIFKQWAITNQWAGNYKTAGITITPLKVQCWLQWTVWLKWIN